MLCPRWCHGCFGEPFTAISTPASGHPPLMDGEAFIVLSRHSGHISPSPATEHHTGSRGIPAPPSQKVGFFPSVSPHPPLTGRASITTVRLEVIEAGDEERAHILSREAGKKCSKDKHPVELREVNSRREPRFPPFPGVSIIPLRFNMHSDYFY